MGRYKRKKTKYLKTIMDKNRIWVKSDMKGIRIVEMYGFMEIPIMDMPNEIHIEGFQRRINYLFSMLGINSDGNKKVMKELRDIEKEENRK